MTDDELILRARKLLANIGKKRLGVDIDRREEWMAIDVVEDALPALFRAVDERDDLRERVAELEDALADYPKWLGKLPHE